MRLFEFAGEARTLYVCRPVLNTKDIHDWAREQGFKTALADGELHVTVAYSKEPVVWTTISETDAELTIDDGEREVKKFDKGAVVLKFESDELQDRWQEFRDHGCSWDHPSYQAHITITYNGEDLDISGMEPYDGPIELGPEKFAKVERGWSGKAEETKLDEDVLSQKPAETNSLIDNPAFKKWFADSKVVDRRGKPLKVFHGTDAHFDTFATPSHFGTVRSAHHRLTHRFGPKPAGQHIMPVYLRIRNPLRVTDAEASDEATLLHSIVRGAYPKLDARVARRDGAYVAALQAGYDGLVYRNKLEDIGRDSWVIFHPSQAKSAIGNRRFDGKKASIVEAMRLDDFDDIDALYSIFADSYKKETGVAWTKGKFFSRAQSWVFYGDETGYVAVRPQRSGMKKLVAVAGAPRGILKGLDELQAEGGPIWGAMSEPLARMAKKRGMIVPHLVMGGPTILKALMKTIPSEVFGGVTPEVQSDGGIILDYPDTGRAVKYLVGNKEYFKQALGLQQVKDALAKIPGVGMALKLMGVG